jgi:hypothetical protein
MYSSLAIAAVMLLAADDPNAPQTGRVEFVASQTTEMAKIGAGNKIFTVSRPAVPVAFRREADSKQPAIKFARPLSGRESQRVATGSKAAHIFSISRENFSISQENTGLQTTSAPVVEVVPVTEVPAADKNSAANDASQSEEIPTGEIVVDGIDILGVGPTYADETTIYEEGYFDLGGPVAEPKFRLVMPVRSPGDMPIHIPHLHKFSEYYYPRPYNWFHIQEHQEEALNHGGDARHPYTNRVFADVYKQLGISPHPTALPIMPDPKKAKPKADSAAQPKSGDNSQYGVKDASTAAVRF